jgi:hypothetical protein
MKTFVIIFSSGSGDISDPEKQKRAAETSVWAKRHLAAGHKLDPRILAPEAAHLDIRGAEHHRPLPGAWPLTALLFLEAEDLQQAVSIAESHPGYRYGTIHLEVRPWGSPIPAIAAQLGSGVAGNARD